MTALSPAIAPATIPARRGGMFLGFPNAFRKEVTEWLRGPKVLIVAGVSIAGAVFMTLIPFIAVATKEAEAADLFSTDPTANVLLGWTGQSVALIAIVATMTLFSTERDRGTLPWSLSNPVSPTSVLAAKGLAAFLMLTIAAILVPIAVSVALATIIYGLPDLAVVGSFAVLFLTLPAFYIALTVALGTGIKSTAGVAGAAFAVVFVPQILGGIVPLINELSPTSIGGWAMAVAKGDVASNLTLVGWAVSMAILVVGAKLVFDRQEL
ncbi:MAG TPA: ABC transporter permease subunit [Candidatus Limnocylindrales bacterium]|jgi:ABC-type transport system involved in multi-copper enzyme maturation permease subunit